MHPARKSTCSRRTQSSRSAEATNAGWRSLCKFIARYHTAAVLEIRSPNLFQQTLSSILQKGSIDRPLPSIPFFVPATTAPHAQHGVYPTIRIRPPYANMETLQGSGFIFDSNLHASNDVFRSQNVHMEPNKAADPRKVRLFLDLSSSLDLSVVVPSPRDHPQRGRRRCALMYGLHFPSTIVYEDVGSRDGGLPPQNRRSCFLVSSTRMSWPPPQRMIGRLLSTTCQ